MPRGLGRKKDTPAPSPRKGVADHRPIKVTLDCGCKPTFTVHPKKGDIIYCVNCERPAEVL